MTEVKQQEPRHHTITEDLRDIGSEELRSLVGHMLFLMVSHLPLENYHKGGTSPAEKERKRIIDDALKTHFPGGYKTVNGRKVPKGINDPSDAEDVPIPAQE